MNDQARTSFFDGNGERGYVGSTVLQKFGGYGVIRWIAQHSNDATLPVYVVWEDGEEGWVYATFLTIRQRVY